MIYFIQAEGIGHVKIGYTDGDDVSDRAAALQTGSPVPLRVLGTILGTLEDEKNLHRRFAAHRVHGEWFKPVPELLALFTAAEREPVDGIEVVERSVTIRVLTVGRKQFSKSLLEQLPQVECFWWQEAMGCAADDMPEDASPKQYAARFDFRPFIHGEIWGWVVGGYATAREGRSGHYRWVIHVTDGALCKDKHFLRQTPAAPSGLTHSDFLRNTELAKALGPRLYLVPGFRDEDQLFIGA